MSVYLDFFLILFYVKIYFIVFTKCFPCQNFILKKFSFFTNKYFLPKCFLSHNIYFLFILFYHIYFSCTLFTFCTFLFFSQLQLNSNVRRPVRDSSQQLSPFQQLLFLRLFLVIGFLNSS